MRSHRLRDSIPLILADLLTPRILPFLLTTRTLESRISVITAQMSLNTTLLELLL